MTKKTNNIILKLSINVELYKYAGQLKCYIIFTQPPPLGQDMTQGQFFLRGV